ncbi:mannose-6-phosphate isomerase, class I [Haloglycomyces albus]|uniref:mannose-6-phosphate isomerase, class I n=1 Tax=Haloglycomyces albus TaxID=526067 RepID=UPI00046D712F|nr:mannose-6-phosphate isomerase, class I [Haloglycomyces albus]
MQELEGVIRNYAWGSQVDIARMQGRAYPTELPEAEEWFGAHPTAPSFLADGRSLDTAVKIDPKPMLGDEVLNRYGARVPFMMKLLAAARPLSLQAHPNARQAHAGYVRERRMGVDFSSRNYVDSNHKPELLVALSEFRALCGFRDPLEAARDVESLEVEGLKDLAQLLRSGEGSLRRAVSHVLTTDLGDHNTLVDQAAKAAGGRTEPEFEMLVELAKTYPNDPGVLVSLLLNHLVLSPGEAVYMPAGNMHAYLRGFGVEIMAASDNVLRGGLTGKKVDVPELLRVLDFRAMTDPLQPHEDDGPVRTWPVPVDDFQLHRVTLSGNEVTIDLPGPRILLAVEGAVQGIDKDGEEQLRAGQAAFSRAESGPMSLGGTGTIFVAHVGG